MEGGMSPLARSPKRATHAPAPAPAWQLVWLSEIAFKAQLAERRAAMAAVAQSTGGSFVVFKSSDRYSKYLQEDVRPPFVLVTGWREAKPCVDEMARRPELPRPSRVLVLPEPQQLHKATSWAAAQRMDVPVRVVADMQELRASLAGQDAQHGAQLVRQQPVEPMWGPPLPPKELSSPIAALERPFAKKKSWADVTDDEVNDGKVNDGAPWVSQSPLAAMMSSMDPHELARILTSAMPECYED